MESLALVQRDLVLTGGQYLMVSGSDKIRQDLTLALREDYGSDPYHPYWGSVLQRFIGHPLTPEVQQLVQTEVRRVLRNYIAVQSDLIRADSASGARSRFDTSDVVQAVENIAVTITGDRIDIVLTLQTQSGQTVTIRRQVLA